MTASNVVMQNGLVVFGAVVGLVVLFKIFAKTKTGTYLLDVAKINAPMFGSLVRRTAVARMTRRDAKNRFASFGVVADQGNIDDGLLFRERAFFNIAVFS